MVSRQEWARMCEPYLTGDSGVTLASVGIENDYPDETEVNRAIRSLIANYQRLIDIANDPINSVEDRLEAYRVANDIFGHLAFVEVNPLAGQ